MVALDDDDPLWEQHSGGEGHSGIEWEAGDGAVAAAFYAALPEHTRFVFDLLMDHPGERLTSDWIAEQLTARRPEGVRAANRRSVSTSMSPTAQPTARSGRRMPFYWWRTNGGASSYAMKPTVAHLFRDARQTTIASHAEPGSGDWNATEITAAVDDYLAMLQAELAGQSYSKARHRRALLSRLSPVRTAAAVEFKHQNISAAILELGLPYIRGYKPMNNYQAALTAEIQRHMDASPQLLRILGEGTSAGTPTGSPLQRTAPPSPSPGPAASRGTVGRAGQHPDYGALEEENRRRGAQGEELVVRYERSWLDQHGRPDLASRVRWIARDDGDGPGYDVLSYDLDEHERYIEVKTTRLGAETPFYISSAELAFARRNPGDYVLYRVYDILGQPRFFALEGDIGNVLELTTVTYRAQLAPAAPGTSPLGGAQVSSADACVPSRQLCDAKADCIRHGRGARHDVARDEVWRAGVSKHHEAWIRSMRHGDGSGCLLGKEFRAKTGLPFTCQVSGAGLVPDCAGFPLHVSNFRTASGLDRRVTRR